MNNKFTTVDGLLTIDRDFSGIKDMCRFLAANGRICFCASLEQITIVNDDHSDHSDHLYVEFEKATMIYLDSKEEALSVAEFLGLDTYKFHENGNDYIKN